VEGTDVGEQFTVAPAQEDEQEQELSMDVNTQEQELSVDVNAPNGDANIDVAEQPVHGFETFSSVTASYDEQPEVVFGFDL